MPLTKERYRAAVAAIDAANAEDPNTLVGSSEPLALAQGVAATRWVSKLTEDPSEALLLAARAHHLRRWEVPRESFPDGRAGYLRWRTERKKAHARDAALILGEAGYNADESGRVGEILEKRDLTSDPEVQVFEDVVALVFFETQLGETADDLGPRALDVLAKAVRKMSPTGVERIPEAITSHGVVLAEALAVVDEDDPFGADDDRTAGWQEAAIQTKRLLEGAT